jgi:hypothetical protein
VGVFVMDCTTIGANPPTFLFPTIIWRVLRRFIESGIGVFVFQVLDVDSPTINHFK